MENKSIAKNAAFNVLYKLVNIIFPLITSIYISHVLLASGVGRVSYAQNIAQYFVLIAPLGIVTYGTREIAKIREKKEFTEKLFTELFLINAASTIFCSVVYYGIVWFTSILPQDKALLLISGLPIILNIFNVEWFYQGNEDYAYIAVRSSIIKIASLFLIIMFVKNADDYLYYALIYSLGTAGNQLLNVVNLIRKGIKFRFESLSFKRHLKPILILLASTIAMELYNLLDVTMLGAMCNYEIVGYYTNSIKLVKILVTLIAAIGGVLLPRLSYYVQKRMLKECSDLVNEVASIMLFLAIPCGVGMYVLADKIVLLIFGETFLPAISTLRIGTILIYILGFGNLFGTQVLLTFKEEKKLLFCTVIGAISNIIMNVNLIPIFQHNGAIVASVISEMLVTFLTVFFVKKYINLHIGKTFVIKTIIGAVVMGVCVYCISIIVKHILLCVIISVLIGIVVFVLWAVITKNPIVKRVITYLKF